MDPAFTLSGSTLAAIGTVLGALSGAITFLFKQLVASKDAQIRAQQEEIVRLHAARTQGEDRIRAEWRERLRSESEDYERRIKAEQEVSARWETLTLQAHGILREAAHALDKAVK